MFFILQIYKDGKFNEMLEEQSLMDIFVEREMDRDKVGVKH